MIFKVHPSLSDFENLSRLKVEASDFANTFDYRRIVVNKPWGYEYLWFQNETVAIWFLYIGEGQSTSLHCHAHKRTSLIVLDGTVQCTTLEDKYRMNTLDGIVLEPCVFHSSKAMSTEGTFIMEIETPPMKGDLVRMNDAYGRQHTGYEKTNEYSDEFDQYEYYPFDGMEARVWKFRDLEILLTKERPECGPSTKMVVPISGFVESKKKKAVIEAGEAVPAGSELDDHELDHSSYEFLVFNSTDRR
jgi:mannose-6-phosphate isomerase-like protein (cupin superfamily)